MSALQQNLQRGALIGIEEAQAGNFPLRDFKMAALPLQTPPAKVLHRHSLRHLSLLQSGCWKLNS
jgi:hypothetical protein